MKSIVGKVDPSTTNRVIFPEPFPGRPFIVFEWAAFLYDMDEAGFSFILLQETDREIRFGAQFEPPRVTH